MGIITTMASGEVTRFENNPLVTMIIIPQQDWFRTFEQNSTFMKYIRIYVQMFKAKLVDADYYTVWSYEESV